MDLAVSRTAAENGLDSASEILFRDESSMKFHRLTEGAGSGGGGGGGDASRKTTSLAVPRFVIDGNNNVFAVGENGHFFGEAKEEMPQRCVFGANSLGQKDSSRCRPWNAEGNNGTPSGDMPEGEEEDEGEDDDGHRQADGTVSTDNNIVTKCHSNGSGSVQSSSERSCHEKVNLQENISLFGSERGDPTKNARNSSGSVGKHQQYQPCPTDQYENAITIREPECSYARILQGEDVSSIVQRKVEGENGCNIVGRKVTKSSNEPVESLRMHLSDPITGALMDDALILSCGHSYGSAGMQQIDKMKACYKCGCSVAVDSIRPNLAVRSAVLAYRREESQLSKASRQRRDKREQEKFDLDESSNTDISRGKGVQFPFVVSDRVIIKGNKRTPQRFVGRVAVVTTQCLNGWYVVKTLDNAESVKLQYRSLAKVTEDMISNKSPVS